MAKIRLDCIKGENVITDAVFEAFRKDVGIAETPTGETGAGGWNEYEYEGEPEALETMVQIFWGDKDLCEYIEK